MSIQTAAPYRDGRYTNSYVQHCGISVGYTYTLAGLVMGRDFPGLVYHADRCAKQRLTEVSGGNTRTGDYGIIDWNWNGWGRDRSLDHAVLIVGMITFPTRLALWNGTRQTTVVPATTERDTVVRRVQ